MKEIKVCLDETCYKKKPVNSEIAKINKGLAYNVKTLKSTEEILKFMRSVGEDGRTFCPTTFNGSTKTDCFEQIQMMPLDFDGTIPFDDVKKRAEKYELPIMFAYDTFSSVNHDRFRIIFLNDVSINDPMAANSQDVFMDTFVQIVPFGDFYKKGEAVSFIQRNIENMKTKRRMIRLVSLLPEKKSLLLAQKALQYREIDDIMEAFAKIGLSPITIGKRNEIKRLENLYSYLV